VQPIPSEFLGEILAIAGRPGSPGSPGSGEIAPSGLATQNAPAGAEGSQSSPQSLASDYFIAALWLANWGIVPILVMVLFLWLTKLVSFAFHVSLLVYDGLLWLSCLIMLYTKSEMDSGTQNPNLDQEQGCSLKRRDSNDGDPAKWIVLETPIFWYRNHCRFFASYHMYPGLFHGWKWPSPSPQLPRSRRRTGARAEESRPSPPGVGIPWRSVGASYGMLSMAIFVKGQLYWLVVLTILKNISLWEGLSHILWKITHIWNHQPEI